MVSAYCRLTVNHCTHDAYFVQESRKQHGGWTSTMQFSLIAVRRGLAAVYT